MATRTSRSELSKIVDTTTNSTFVYIGEAEIGSLTSDPVWFVKRINLTNGALIEVANGGEPDQIWDNRVGLTYSI